MAPTTPNHEGAAVWSPRQHVPELDGLRGLAILLVTGYRFLAHTPSDSNFGWLFAATVQFGQRGVDLFFVLSGFLITGILLDSRDQPHFFRNFFARRTLRIFPLYFFSLWLFLYVVPAIWPSHPYGMAVEEQSFLWTYLANLRIATADFWCFGSLDHFWSLAVEEHFYLLWPVVVFFVGLKHSARMAILAAAGCSASRILFALLSDNGTAADVASFFRFDGLLLGAAVAAAIRNPGGLAALRGPAKVALAAFVPVCLGLGLHAGRLLTISHSCWAILWTAVLILIVTAPRTSPVARGLRGLSLRSLGKYSYGLYVFQSPLIPLVAGSWSVSIVSDSLGWDQTAWLPAHLIYAFGMFALTYATALLSWHLLERHCLKLKNCFPTQAAIHLPKRAAVVPAE